VVPLGEVAGKYIEEYLRESRPRLMEGKAPCSTLFVTRDGKGLGTERLRRYVARYERKAGIAKHVTPHVFRHTFATHLLKGGADIRHIQEMLGHKKIDSTQIYTHVAAIDMKKEHRRCHPREQAR
jgi:integrase/recombinase XerD